MSFVDLKKQNINENSASDFQSHLSPKMLDTKSTLNFDTVRAVNSSQILVDMNTLKLNETL